MISTALVALALASHVQEAAPAEQAPPPPSVHATADATQPHGTLRFRVTSSSGKPLPCRLTFVTQDGEAPELFPNTEVAPTELAVRQNVVYSLSGVGAITVPVGTYSVYATRGMEYGLAAELLTFTPGAELTFEPTLEREVVTAGWMGGDFHLHTLTHSGHGDANLNERLISLIGEGVEIAVATDHNHHTDYRPTLEALGAKEEVMTVVGNEVSVPIGHFNAFPLDPEHPVPDPGATDANALFKLIREEPNEFDVVPVIQLNHPRWGGIDYFTQTGLDPVTGLASSPSYSADFDTLEVLNENAGWGYHDADTATIEVGAGIHSVLGDWYNLLNRGQRCFAVGNSDSHTVRGNTAGYPRNYVACSASYPWQVDVAEVAASLRAGRVFTTTGPFVEFKVDGHEMGSEITSETGRVLCYVRIRAPQWMYLSRVKFVVNGDLWKTVDLDPFVLEDGTITWPILQEVLVLEQDSWVHVIVEGDEPLEPIVTPQDRPVLPLAITNPVWVHMSDSPTWTSPYDYAGSLSGMQADLAHLAPRQAALLVQATVARGRQHTPRIVHEALASRERIVQLAGLRAAEELGESHYAGAVSSLLAEAQDAFFALAATRALAACEPERRGPRLLHLFERFGHASLARYPRELEALVDGEPLGSWSVIGPFENPTGGELFEGDFGPLGDPMDDAPRAGKGGEVAWTTRTASEEGYLDLSPADEALRDRSLSYARAFVEVPEAREVLYAAGSDDGVRLWINGEELYSDSSQRGAAPMQHVGRASLAAGWNEVLLGVENGGGATGLYFRFLDSEFRSQAQRPQ